MGWSASVPWYPRPTKCSLQADLSLSIQHLLLANNLLHIVGNPAPRKDNISLINVWPFFYVCQDYKFPHLGSLNNRKLSFHLAKYGLSLPCKIGPPPFYDSNPLSAPCLLAPPPHPQYLPRFFTRTTDISALNLCNLQYDMRAHRLWNCNGGTL